MLLAWRTWERIATWRYRPRPLRPGSILLCARGRYRGAPIRLRDGTTVSTGSRVLALHLDNGIVLSRPSERWQTLWSGLREMSADLDLLARMARDGQLDDVVALYGLSLFASEARVLGFESRPLPRTFGAALIHFYLVGIAAVYHEAGWRGVGHLRTSRWPGEMWMSIDELRRRSARHRSDEGVEHAAAREGDHGLAPGERPVSSPSPGGARRRSG